MVADNTEVISRKAGEDKTWRWTSDGKTGFELEEVTGDAARKSSGTTVLIHFNDEGAQYANSYRLQEIIKKYSNHIAFPIFRSSARRRELS
jgi:molecular chaperone HtpG